MNSKPKAQSSSTVTAASRSPNTKSGSVKSATNANGNHPSPCTCSCESPMTPLTAADWKNIGNKHFVVKHYKKAIIAYTTALKLAPNDADILSNRAAAYLNIRLFELSVGDCDTVLNDDQFYSKAIYRKVKALQGQAKYADAKEFLSTKLKSRGIKEKKKELKLLLRQIELQLKQQLTGDYDMLYLLTSKPTEMHEFADYTGPVKITNVDGKGRGLTATEDIKAGQIVIASKALGIIFPDEQGYPFISRDSGLPLKMLCQQITASVETDEEMRQNLSKLYSGPHNEFDDEMKTDNDNILNTQRLSAICYFNSFEVSESSPISAFSPMDVKNEAFCGLWLLPSYINHSCVESNSRWANFGNFMIVRAFKDIPKDAEILISYFSPAKTYEERKAVCDTYDFTCKCILCTLEKAEDPSVGPERRRIMTMIDENQNYEEKYLLKYLTMLERLRPDHPHLNFCVLSVLEDLVISATEGKDIPKAAAYMERAYKIVQGTTLARLAVGYAAEVIKQYYALKNRPAAKIWLKNFDRSVETVYGKSQDMKEYLLERGLAGT